MNRKVTDTIVVVVTLPDCDIHKYYKKVTGVKARYDAVEVNTGQWGFMCTDCFKKLGPTSLGIGRGQVLMTEEQYEEFKGSFTEPVRVGAARR